MRIFVALIPILSMLLAAGNPAYSRTSMGSYGYKVGGRSDNPDLLVNRPVNIQGLTGLIVTNSAYTQPKGRFTIGLSGLGENSNTPDYSVVQGIFTATYGATDRIEVGLKSKLIATNLGSSSTRETGMGDTDLLFKWRMSSQGEDLPAMAFGIALTLPTGDETKGFSEVKHEGVRLMLIGAHEKKMPQGITLGLYAEGQIVLIDQLDSNTGSSYKDKYGVLNMGVLFPVTESNRLQLILEYNVVTKKDVPTVAEQDYTAVTPGLRYVTPQLNVTVGAQLLNRDTGYSNNTRYIATLSYRF